MGAGPSTTPDEFARCREGDYYRYGAEVSAGAEKETYKTKAGDAYTAASTAATDETSSEPALAPTNPILLGLGLNQSVFYYEVTTFDIIYLMSSDTHLLLIS